LWAAAASFVAEAPASFLTNPLSVSCRFHTLLLILLRSPMYL
jgi:hypothetical protein